MGLDKCCIDQGSIETHLRCLPVFLAGCRRIVVFCGPTYLCRLWCIFEIFTFAHMGRSLENLEFEIVLRPGHEHEDLQMVEDALDEFDADRCNCHAAEDKDRMLNIIYSSFGSMDAFNVAVRSMLRATRLRETCAVQSRTLTNKTLTNRIVGEVPDSADDDGTSTCGPSGSSGSD